MAIQHTAALPLHCTGVVVIVDGDAEVGHHPVARLAPLLKKLPLMAAIHLTCSPTVGIIQLSPGEDADAVLQSIRDDRPGAPIVLVGRCEGGRIALDLMDEPDVVAVAALDAPVDADEQVHGRRGQSALLVSESDPGRGQAHAERLRGRGLNVTWRSIEAGPHASVLRFGGCQREVGQFVDRVLARTGN